MKKINTTDGNTKLVILDETLWSKEICKVKTKKSLYDFTDADVNMRRDKAVLIFSTHYSELLDEFNRNDSIYIIKNKEGITAEKLSGILKRNDIKKSEVYDSDFIGGTVPAYESYIALKKALASLRQEAFIWQNMWHVSVKAVLNMQY